MTLEDITGFLKNYDGPSVRLMEVCGSHTGAIAGYGIPGMLSERIELLSGPGCPVCVTPSAYIDRLIEYSKEPHHAVVSFGDLIRVPGSVSSLSEAKGEGGRVVMVYSPLDVIDLAKKEEETTFVFAAVGFETTAPVYADLVERIRREGLSNVRLLTAVKTMPAVISHLMDHGAAIDGFLAPGHVSVVTGSEIFVPLAERYGIPFAVAGFSGKELLLALYDLVRNRGRGIVKNDYPSVVKAEGNTRARELVNKVFEPAPAVWRGMGSIAGSGLFLRKEYEGYDAGSRDCGTDRKKNAACICDEILMGKRKPRECPLFGKVCTPASPQGACMVSAEGSCFVYLTDGRER